VDHLTEGRSYWSNSGENWTYHFGATRAEINGMDWEGLGGESAFARSVVNEGMAYEAAAVVQAAETIAQMGASDLMALRSTATSAIAAAEEDGFTVGKSLEVTDNAPVPAQMLAARQALAEAHNANIVGAVEALYTHDSAVAAAMQAHTEALRGIALAG
jgi:hypothetical protein